MENENYPSNSYKSKAKQETINQPEKKAPVVTGKVTAKKTGVFEHILSELIPNTASEIGQSIVNDILIPGIREGIHGAIDTIFGGASRGQTYISSPSGRINYSGISRGQTSVNHSQSMSKRTYEFESLTFATRSDAEAVLNEMRQHIYAYDMVRVSDLFEFADVSFDYTAQKYGWTDLSTARVYRTIDGWKIDLPRAIVLD